MNIRGHALRHTAALVAVLLATVLWCCPSFAGDERPLRIAYPDYWPFFTRTPADEMTGIFHDIIHEAVEKRMGTKVEWAEYPWKRCQANVREDKADAMVTVPTPERADYTLTHSHPFYIKSMHIFTWRDNPRLRDIMRVRTLDDVLRMGLTVITYAGNGWNDENVRAKGIEVLETHNRPTVWSMLARERGDMVIEWPGGAWPDIHRLDVAHDVMDTGIALHSMPFHLLINKDSPHVSILATFDQVIADMIQDGTMGRILARYEGLAEP